MNKTDLIDLQFTTLQEEVPDFIYDGLKPYAKLAFAYQPQPLFLRESLARKFNITPEQIFLVNGVDEALRICIESFGENTHIFTPSEYSTTHQFCPTVTAHYSENKDEYLISSENIKDATLIILANPNNPIGYTTPDVIEELIKNNPKAVVAIDEIYGEYAPELSVVNLLNKYSNLIVFRGFSKSYGLPGIRLGYILSSLEVLKALSEKSTWSNVSVLSCGAAKVALDHEDYYKNLREIVMKRKSLIVNELKSKKYKIIPSLINTIVIKFSSDLEAINFVDKLKSNNILINIGESGGKIGTDNTYASFTVGTEGQMARLLKVIEESILTEESR